VILGLIVGETFLERRAASLVKERLKRLCCCSLFLIEAYYIFSITFLIYSLVAVFIVRAAEDAI
jgi:hypothetical protein